VFIFSFSLFIFKTRKSNCHLREALSEGLPAHIERHKKLGKYSARERVDLVLDQDSPFLELMPLAGTKVG
jgi:acetyl-CoA carboxylase carboxyltransferase component